MRLLRAVMNLRDRFADRSLAVKTDKTHYGRSAGWRYCRLYLESFVLQWLKKFAVRRGSGTGVECRAPDTGVALVKNFL